MKAESKTWLLIGAAIIAAIAFEMVTVIVFGHPMSWAMQEAPNIVIAVVCLAGGCLMGHFWWPAKARWPRQDRMISNMDDPLKASDQVLRNYANNLWRVHSGGE